MRRRQSRDHDLYRDLYNANCSNFENRSIQSSYSHSKNYSDTFYPQQSQIPSEPSYQHVEQHTYDLGSRVDQEPPQLAQYNPIEHFESHRRPDLVNPFEEYKNNVEFAREFWEEHAGEANRDGLMAACEEDDHQSKEIWPHRQQDLQTDCDIDPFDLDPQDDDAFSGDHFSGW